MILVDTSVWVDHLRAHDPALAAAREAGLGRVAADIQLAFNERE